MVAKSKPKVASFPTRTIEVEHDKPVQEELFEPLTMTKGPRRYKLPKYPPSHLNKNWVKPRSWGQLALADVLVAFPEEWLPGKVITKIRDLVLTPGQVTVLLDRGGLIEAEVLTSLRIEAEESEALRRSLHGG